MISTSVLLWAASVLVFCIAAGNANQPDPFWWERAGQSVRAFSPRQNTKNHCTTFFTHLGLVCGRKEHAHAVVE